MNLKELSTNHDGTVSIRLEVMDAKNFNRFMQHADRFTRNQRYDRMKKTKRFPLRPTATLCDLFVEVMDLFEPRELSKIISTATAARLNPK